MSVVANIKLDFKALEKIRADLSRHKNSRVKVGILGANNARQEGQLTNPQIGVIHEKGSMTSDPPIPRRSFLEDPLTENMGRAVADAGPEFWRDHLLERGVEATLGALGAVGENVVQHAFETGHDGKWKKLSPFTVAKKGSSAILIETAQLRKSITSEVVAA